MRTFRSSLFLVLLAALLLLGMQNASPSSSLAHAAKTPDPDADALVAEFSHKKGLGRLVDWGLAKIEKVYDVGVSDLFAAFKVKCDHLVTIMIHSFRDLTLSYETLHEKEAGRLKDFDDEFRDLVKMRNKIDRKCLYSTNTEDRSLCIAKGIDIHSKIEDLRGQRTKSAAAIERYKGMIEWCATWSNWFC
ncbi:hypothetical protein ACHAXT_001826 [Thalassiosira profunda]